MTELLDEVLDLGVIGQDGMEKMLEVTTEGFGEKTRGRALFNPPVDQRFNALSRGDITRRLH